MLIHCKGRESSGLLSHDKSSPSDMEQAPEHPASISLSYSPLVTATSWRGESGCL